MVVLRDLRFTLAQVNPTVGDIHRNESLILETWATHDAQSDLIIFPEMVICGYMPEDLLLQAGFIDRIETSLQSIAHKTAHLKSAALIGTPFRKDGKLYNATVLIEGGQITTTRLKHNLPNYGVFDECRYFVSGSLPEPVAFRGAQLGVMVCEDMWFSDVAQHLKSKGAEILISQNASPYEWGKHAERVRQARSRVEETSLPLIYVNQIGGQDDLVFDGASFVINATGDLICQCPEFMEYAEHFSLSNTSQKMSPIMGKDASLYHAVMVGLADYLAKTGQSKILIGMSGGIDSALSAAIAVDALGADNVHGVIMPSPYTSQESIEDAQDCAARLGFACDLIPITPMMESFSKLLPAITGLAHENMQARLRGLILMSLSNQTGAMVLTTGNKSEMATGYATLYGDMCGGYNVLKDIYKTEVYALARWRNSCQKMVINDRILAKAPTAELRDNQTDQDSLPPYDVLDRILFELIENYAAPDDIVAQGFDAETVGKVARLLKISEYKRRQSAPGPKVSARAFTRERRLPIANGA